MSTTRSKTVIERAVRAQLSYKTQAMVGATAVTIIPRDGHPVTLTRAEFDKLVEADAEFRIMWLAERGAA